MHWGIGAGLALVGLAAVSPAMAGDPAPIGGVRLVQPVSIPVLSDFRLRVVLPPSDSAWRMQGPQSLARRGTAGALVDFYPFDEHFHLSAGGRMFSRAGARSTDPASLQLLPAFRVPGVRAGRKFTPTMLMGYSSTGASGLALGVDAGVLMGQSDPTPDFRLQNGAGPRAPGGVNGLARMTMRYPF
jgi:hypothetical protein